MNLENNNKKKDVLPTKKPLPFPDKAAFKEANIKPVSREELIRALVGMANPPTND